MNQDIEQLIHDVLHGQATAADAERLSVWIVASKDNARAYYRVLSDERAIHRCLEQDAALAVSQLSDASDDSAAGFVLAELAQAEANAEATLVELVQIRDRHWLAGSIMKYAWAVLIAVATLTAVIVMLLVGPSGAPTSIPVAGQPQATPSTSPVDRAIVATLTATHNAQWAQPSAERALARGSTLKAGDRLTLTAGFAEITTISGAVVILDAPAAVELLDNDNAVRLHTGKLVGICQTDSSKGFVVSTNNAVVTDLGTEFGVEVMPDGSTQALVFSGEIELREISESANQVTRGIRLTEGWSSRVGQQGRLQKVAKRVTTELASIFVMSIDEVADPGLAYRHMVLASDPIVYWGFDEEGDTTANLAGQDAWNGKALGQIDHGQGIFGAGLKLTGEVETMGGIQSVRPLNFDKLEAYTLEAWYRADRAQHGRVLGLDDVDPTSKLPPKTFSIIELSDGPTSDQQASSDDKQIRYTHRHPPTKFRDDGYDAFSERVSPIGDWVHVVAVKDGNVLRLYINGELVHQSEDAQPVATGLPMTLCVGISAYAITPNTAVSKTEFRPFAGLIDEVAVYDTALSEQTIQAHYQSGRSNLDGQRLPE